MRSAETCKCQRKKEMKKKIVMHTYEIKMHANRITRTQASHLVEKTKQK